MKHYYYLEIISPKYNKNLTNFKNIMSIPKNKKTIKDNNIKVKIIKDNHNDFFIDIINVNGNVCYKSNKFNEKSLNEILLSINKDMNANINKTKNKSHTFKQKYEYYKLNYLGMLYFIDHYF